VDIPASMDLMKLHGDAKTLLDHFSTGGGLKQFGFFEHPVVKKHGESVKQVRVNGQECLDRNVLPKLINYLKVKFLLKEIWSFWVGKVTCQPEKHPLMQIAEIDELIEALEHILSLYSLRAEVLTIAERIPGLPRPQFENVESLNELMNTCHDVLKQSVLKELYQKMLLEEGRISAVVAHTNAHPLCGELFQAFKVRNADGYCAAVNKIKAVGAQRSRVVAKHTYINAITTKAPRFASTLKNGHDKQAAVQRLKELDKAWAWKQASDWMYKFHNQDGNVLERNIHRLEISSAKALEELATLKAWSHCFSRMTRDHQQYLESWHQSIRRLGKGTGKHAHKHRQDAQKSLNECKGAVPSWIMPLHRVYETVEASPGCFDVIIVDEASQCGYEALPLLYLAKKIIVVGDEKQISPEAVCIDRSHVFNLMKTHLADFKHSASFDIENSLFAHGRIRFGNRITLQEHFRCAPEIIRFSNELCYTSDPLIPLKQVPPNRLEPLKAIHVPTGYREGSGQTIVNKPEAEAIVETIIKCCKDSMYAGMTMGVIVLQGDAQAKIIEDMLVKRLGTEEMQERRLLCGNPYSFQGDERDVIFLSLVAATNERIGAFVQEKDMRRFNVAASRAREQMWLFHSVTSNDLSNTCLRKRLLSHFYDTSVRKVAGISVEDLQRAAHIADRWREQPPDPFDSWFEVDVALHIAGRGYTVVPQYEFVGKRIDLVIQGGSAQLAVECDGDHWHGRDKYEEDMQRQRMLERCNWVFFRVRESNYRINKEQALEQLWGMLEARGISPKGSEQCSSDESAKMDSEAANDHEEFGQNDTGVNDDMDDTSDTDDVDSEMDSEDAIDESENPLEDCPLSIQAALNTKPADLQHLIIEAMKTLPNNTCVRKALTTIILKKCHIRTRGTPRSFFARKVESQVAVMIRDGKLVAYKSKNERLKLGWNFTYQ
jgi:very-short-patch-repair endonuclease